MRTISIDCKARAVPPYLVHSTIATATIASAQTPYPTFPTYRSGFLSIHPMFPNLPDFGYWNTLSTFAYGSYCFAVMTILMLLAIRAVAFQPGP